MNERRPAAFSLVMLACLVALLIEQPALACPVCVGDPMDPLSQGLRAGMLVLLGVVGVVLTGLASLLLFWVHRAAQLKQ
jgi:hypothetical protein